ncbi:hypothetical protein MRB53_030655 [Persea americana]|uniref:Uncharacterized protein n=1 Tax=Persea americana TaxID=3435 RepID=A0ACC2KLX6_PERAE|nr:hypothetical protein MRB53_030655 [Persea americana]
MRNKEMVLRLGVGEDDGVVWKMYMVDWVPLECRGFHESGRIQEHVGSGMQRKKQRQTTMIVLCDGHSQPVKEFEQFHVEGEIQPVLALL